MHLNTFDNYDPNARSQASSTLVEYSLDRSIPSGWTMLARMILIFSGVQLIVMGILWAYIGGIYEEVKDALQQIVDEPDDLVHEESTLT